MWLLGENLASPDWPLCRTSKQGMTTATAFPLDHARQSSHTQRFACEDGSNCKNAAFAEGSPIRQVSQEKLTR